MGCYLSMGYDDSLWRRRVKMGDNFLYKNYGFSNIILLFENCFYFKSIKCFLFIVWYVGEIW